MNDARSRLEGAPTEALGRWAKPGILRRAPRIERVGEAWRLGVLLLTPQGEALAVGQVVRAAAPARRGFAAESARQRASVREAAVRGGFRPGEVVHIEWEPIDLAAVDAGGQSGPLRSAPGGPLVRWSTGGGWTALAPYLDEKIALLRDPPTGAGG